MKNCTQELKLEMDAVAEGIHRYQTRSQQNATFSGHGVEFIRRNFQQLSDAIDAEQKLACTRGVRLKKYFLPLLSIDPDRLAFLTLQSILNMVSLSDEDVEPELSLTHLAREIGQRCFAERIFDLRRGRARDLERLIKGRYSASNVAKREILRQLDKLDTENWGANNRDLHLGSALVDLAAENGDAVLIEKRRERRGKSYKTTTILRLSDDAREEIKNRKEFYELLSPIYRPMIMPPLKWINGVGGGYLSNRKTKSIDLVKHWNNPEIRGQIQRAAREQRLETVTEAVHALQETRWRINDRVYNVMLQLADSGADSETIQDIRLKLAVCEKMRAESQIYFPYQLDFRGRAYPIPAVINPQADDSGRALLEFADGKPIGERGSDWLDIHLANKFGKDKAPFEERQKWVQDHTDLILAIAHEPLKNQQWLKAKKKWSFLAACLEWAEHRTRGPGFLTHLPVSMDGTCNGLQHLSALARDQRCARATNVLPSSEPQDIYQRVADLVYAAVIGHDQLGRAEAADWLHNAEISREVVKLPTMTTPYGVTRKGIRNQLKKVKSAKNLKHPRESVAYLASVLQDCINQVLGDSRKIMTWLQKKVCRKLSNADLGVYWNSPTGFPVVQENRRLRQTRVSVRGYSLVVYDEESPLKIDSRKQEASIVSNFVHSLDAAHMVLTVNSLYRAGLRNFAMIHDSFAVHACDVDMLNSVLREEFIRIYELPILQRFLEEQRHRFIEGIMIEDPPEVGHFDIQEVRNSKYFFC